MRIQWTKGAKQSLEQIEEYIAQNSPQAAIHTLLKIIKSVAILAVHPEIGRIGRILNTRELIINGTPYIVPYRIKNGYIEILRVQHSAKRFLNHL